MYITFNFIHSLSFLFSGNAAPDYPDIACRNTTNITLHDPPILYDLWMDPGEMTPLDPHENYYLLQKMIEVNF